MKYDSLKDKKKHVTNRHHFNKAPVIFLRSASGEYILLYLEGSVNRMLLNYMKKSALSEGLCVMRGFILK